MLFDRPGKNITEAQWACVKAAVAAGNLGPVAKLAQGTPPGRVMCVYTYCFEDESDVFRVLKQLHTMGVYPTSWKADIVTYIGLYNTRGSSGVLQVPNFQAGWFVPPAKQGPTKRKRIDSP
jgi:hypothetical protein